MSDIFEYDVFLSFASADEEIVKPIWQEMSSSGLRVFWSDETLKQKVGQSWFEIIQNSLVQSEHFVLICTENSMQSNWVKKEYQTFFNLCHIPSNEKRRLVLFRSKGFNISVLPPFLTTLQISNSVEQIISILGGINIQALKEENKLLKQKNERLHNETKKLRDQISHKEEALKAALKEKTGLEKRIKEYEAVTGEKNALVKENTLLKSEQEAQKNELKSITKEKEALEKGFLDKNVRLENRIKELEEEIAQLNQETVETITLKSKPNEIFTNSLQMTFVYIQPGTFKMGSPESELGRYDEEILHEVTLTKGFYLQTTPVTQGQWKAVMGSNPSKFKDCGDNCPVESVSWNDVQEFIKKINEKEGKSIYRLPTEAEWEYACRAGSTSRYYFGNDESELTEYAWYDNNSDKRTQPVGTKKPNAWGLYDMHGNIWEWCEDWYGDYPSGKVTDPTGPSTGSSRVLRGGSWLLVARFCRSASRNGWRPDYRYDFVGFRVLFLRS